MADQSILKHTRRTIMYSTRYGDLYTAMWWELAPSMTSLHPSELTVVCHVRAPLLLEPVDSKIETLRTCKREALIGDLLIRSWSESVSLEPESPHQEVLERFSEFEAWADQNAVSICPPFRVRSSTSLAAAEPRRVLVTPILALALYHETQLVGVYPHSDGETTYTTTDAIGQLRTGATPEPLGSSITPTQTIEPKTDPAVVDGTTATDRQRATDGARETLDACPSCEGDLLNVQGIVACKDCAWTDSELSAIDSPNAKLVYLSVLDGPVSVETLQHTLDFSKIDLFGVLQTLTKRGLVERTPEGYCVSERERATPPAK